MHQQEFHAKHSFIVSYLTQREINSCKNWKSGFMKPTPIDWREAQFGLNPGANLYMLKN